MKFSITLIFTFLFLLVAGFYIYLRPSQESPLAKKIDPPKQLLTLDENDEIVLLQIQQFEEKEDVTLRKQDEKWEIVEPVSDEADPLIVEGLLAAMRLTTKAKRFVREKNWEEYGLKNPKLKVGLETKQKPERRYLILGDTSPVGDFVYARWEGSEEYFLLKDDFKKAFSRSLYSLRQKRVFRMPVQDWSKIRVRAVSDEYELVRHGDKWFWMEPISLLGEAIPQEQVDQIKLQFRQLFVKDFLTDYPGNDEELGFSLVSPSIKVWADEEGEFLDLGEEIPEKDAYYAKRGEEKQRFLIARSNVRGLFEMLQRFSRVSKSSGNAAPVAGL